MKNRLSKEYIKNIKKILSAYLIYSHFFAIDTNVFYDKGKFSYHFHKLRDTYLKLQIDKN